MAKEEKLVNFLKNLNDGRVVEIYQKGYRVYVGLVRNALLFANDNDIVEDWDFSNYEMKVLIK